MGVFGGRVAGSVIEVGGISWIVLEERNDILCVSKEILGRAACGKDSKHFLTSQMEKVVGHQEIDFWLIPSISDYKKFRFLLWLDTDWWLCDQSGDGSIAYVDRKGRIRWSDASELHGIRCFIRFKGGKL